MPASYKWKPLEDLPIDTSALTDSELESLHEVWMDQRDSLAKADVLERFTGELHRQWAIETGIIEGAYSLDRGITQALIERGIEAALIPHEPTEKSPELVARIIQDHLDTLDGMFDFIRGQRELTTGYIKELHASLLRHQETFTVMDQLGREFEKPLEKGAYKTLPNNPTRSDGSVHEYCPPDHVASEMDRMIDLHKKHVSRGAPTEVQAAWLHHVFTQIHPFADGNGRVARAIASLIFLKADWFPLVITRDDRVKYIEALEAADWGNLTTLVAMFVQSQRNGVLQATAAAYGVKPPQTVDEAIGAVRDVLIIRGQTGPKEWAQAKQTAAEIRDSALRRFGEMGQRLWAEIGAANRAFTFPSTRGEGDYYRAPVAKIAEELRYIANTRDYHEWVELGLQGDRRFQIVVSFHTIGVRYRGFVGVAVFLIEHGTNEPKLASSYVFQINYKESPSDTQRRFDPWLEAALIKALDLWRQSI